jgi:GR25 family glycosyltransferase involved in LPS biosynthesis
MTNIKKTKRIINIDNINQINIINQFNNNFKNNLKNNLKNINVQENIIQSSKLQIIDKDIYDKINFIDHIAWINLDRSVERRNNMENILKNIKINNTRISAIDGKVLDTSKFKPPHLSNYEIACLLSHIKAINYLKDIEGEYFLILEDDVSLDNLKYFPINLEDIILDAPEFDILTLYKTIDIPNLHLIDKLEDLYIDYNKFDIMRIWGAAAYIITKDAIDRFIKFAFCDKNNNFNISKQLEVADSFIYKHLNTYIYKYNFFDTTSEVSEIHAHHINIHKLSSKTQLEMLQNDINSGVLKKTDIKLTNDESIYDKINFIDHIVWINLDRSVERRNNMENILRNIKINNTRISAIDGKVLDTSKFKPPHLSNYEIACLLSHIKAINYLKDIDGKYFLVLEDDVSLDNLKYFPIDLEDIILNAPDFDILTLYKTINPPELHFVIDDLKNRYIDYNKFDTIHMWGTVAYIITKDAIDRFIKFASCDKNNNFNISRPLQVADLFIYKHLNTYIYKYNFFDTISNKSEIHQNHNEFNDMHVSSSKLQLEFLLNDIKSGVLKNYDNNINNKLIKSLQTLKKLQFKLNNNMPMTIKASDNAKSWYNNIVDIFIKLYNAHIINTEKLSDVDIYIMTDNDNIINNNDSLKVVISGEPHDLNYDLFDIIIGSQIKKPNHIVIPIPYTILSLNEHKLLDVKYNVAFSDKKMCAFMYSVDYPHRVEIFNKFNSRIKIDAMGKSCNNTNNASSRNVYNDNETYQDIAVKIYSEYKFVLAIENKIKNGYNTEKLINPILANSIPIYYGSDDIFKIINRKRVICFNDFNNIDDLIDYIIQLSKNEEEYNKILNEKIFIRDDINFDNYNDFIIKNIKTMCGFEKRIFINTHNEYDELDNKILTNLDIKSKYYLLDYINKDDEIYKFNKLQHNICDIINNNIVLNKIKKNNKIYLLSFGNEKYYGALERIKIQGESFKIFDEIIIVTDKDLQNNSEYSDFWNTHKDFITYNTRGYGYWIWKSYIILTLLNKINENDIILYVDAGCNLNINGIKRMLEYIEMVNSNDYGILTFQLEQIHLEKIWTKMDLIHYLNCNNEKILNSSQIMATSIIIRKCEHTIKLINKYYNLSCNYNLISDEPSVIPNDITFREHRHDQSILSLLVKTMGGIIIPDETYSLDFMKDCIKFPIWATRDSTNKYDIKYDNKCDNKYYNSSIMKHYIYKIDDILYSIIIPVYNQENIIIENIKSIISHTLLNYELIIILDFCFDNTEQNIINFFNDYNNQNNNLIQVKIFKNSEKPLFETKCDNIGFKNSSGKYCLEIQADMKMIETGYNLHLTKPFTIFDNVIAVSGRCAHNLYESDIGIGKLGINIEKSAADLNIDKNKFYVYETCNRGPLLFDKKKLEELNYLDENEYFLDDSDHDLMARAYIQKKYICGYVPIDFEAPLHLGSTRNNYNNCKEYLINKYEKNKLYKEFKKKLGIYKYKNIWKNKNPIIYDIS